MHIVNVVIVGTGSNGERAWRAAAARPDVNVLCFADNDARKHGTVLHGRQIVDPAALTGGPWDFIVLASMYAPEIQVQLIAQGLAPDRLIAPGVSQYADAFAELSLRKRSAQSIVLDDGRSMLGQDLPEVLIVTCETLNSTHGTGVLLQRFFGDFAPDKLFSVCHTETGQPWLRNSLVLTAGDSATSRGEILQQALRSRAFAPRLVYATAFNEADLELLATVLRVLPPGVPVIQHFMDYMPHDSRAFDRRFAALSDRVTHVWALAKGMARDLEGRYGRPVTHVAALHQDPPAQHRREHRPAGQGFRVAMLGNVWEPRTLPVLQRVWRLCRDRMPVLGPIEWFVHPTRVQAAVDAGYDIGEEIAWHGFYTGAALHERLRAADLAVLPFNTDAQAGDGYTRFSLPSRLTELCGAGLPIVALASPDTEPARFLESRGCGVTVSGPDEMAMASAILQVIVDRDLRARLGATARAVAETELALGPFQQSLLNTLVRLAATSTPIPDWNGPRKEGLVRLAGTDGLRSAPIAEVLTDRVHYACGRNVLPGWVNVDGYDESFPTGDVPADLASQIVRLDLTGPHPFPDDYFRLGYSEDFVEHIDQSGLASFLCEAYRTFRAGGVLRLSTPSLDGILVRHLRGSDWHAAAVLRDEAYTRWCHKHFLCFDELDVMARHIGWREVRRCRYGASSVPGLALETRPTQSDLNLVVELVK
jgi:predicted SAM-dependent methyltransferase